ncbi:MAG: class I SAM-dependent methyltransferase [Ignavibacteria bacterium]|nr:class I SAM-dependent methyltransferase [Ignavibacteria bacterium]
MKKWFETWFGSEDYLSVYSHRTSSEAQQLIAFLQETLQPLPGTSVLDLACGAGRHAESFARNGMIVTGVDLSETLLNIARKNASDQQLTISYLQGDYRYLNLNKQFSIVANLFTSFGYSDNDEENFSLFTAAYSHTAKNGWFVFDYLNSSYLRKTLIPFSKSVKNNIFIEQFRWIEHNCVKKRIVLQRDGALNTYTESVKLYEPDIILAQLRKAGFVPQSIHGDYTGTPFNETESSRLLVLCRKP